MHNATMDPLFSYTHVHTSSFYTIASFLFKRKPPHKTIKSDDSFASSKPTMAAVTPAQTTTQLLLSSTESAFTLPQQIIDLSMISQQQNSKTSSILSSSIGHLLPLSSRLIKQQEVDPPAAQQPRRPAWTESHAYLRGNRTNSDNLRILSAEVNMIRASKITRSLRPRRPYLLRRQDEFVWGTSSPLRIVQYNHSVQIL